MAYSVCPTMSANGALTTPDLSPYADALVHPGSGAELTEDMSEQLLWCQFLKMEEQKKSADIKYTSQFG